MSALRVGSIATAAVALALLSGTPVGGAPAPAAGPGEPIAVLSGSYACDVNDVLYFEPPATEPSTFRETTDRISLASTGGIALSTPGVGGASVIGPGFGGRPVVGGAPPVIGGLFTGHGFNGGTIEDCLRFAESIAAAARGLGCVVSEVRHRPRINYNESVTLSFVCEGSVAAQLHAIGELGRAVVALKPLPAP